MFIFALFLPFQTLLMYGYWCFATECDVSVTSMSKSPVLSTVTRSFVSALCPLSAVPCSFISVVSSDALLVFVLSAVPCSFIPGLCLFCLQRPIVPCMLFTCSDARLHVFFLFFFSAVTHSFMTTLSFPSAVTQNFMSAFCLFCLQ